MTQSCKAVLREVLCAVLGESGPQLDHFQLTLPVSTRLAAQQQHNTVVSHHTRPELHNMMTYFETHPCPLGCILHSM